MVVNDFVLKYIGQEHTMHLTAVLKKHHPSSEYCKGGLYCSIQLDWNYNKRLIDYRVPRYIKKAVVNGWGAFVIGNMIITTPQRKSKIGKKGPI